MVEMFIKTSIMNICAREVTFTKCTRFKCVAQRGNISSKAKLRKSVTRTPAGQTTESSIGDEFRFKLQSGRPQCVILSREGQTRSRFLLLSCVWVAVTFYFHFVGQLRLAGRGRLQAKWHGKQKDLVAVSAVTGCFILFTYWLMEKFVDLANFL